MDWNSPIEREQLLARVGLVEYNRMYYDHTHSHILVTTVNGYQIRPVETRFGKVYVIGNTGAGYAHLQDAIGAALKLPQGE